MTGLGIDIYTDEEISPDLATALRQRGYDALSCQEAQRVAQGISDDAQLAFAARQGRAILAYDGPDFFQSDHIWKDAGRQHAGIIVAPSSVNAFGELLRRVIRHLDTTMPEIQHDTLLWLA